MVWILQTFVVFLYDVKEYLEVVNMSVIIAINFLSYYLVAALIP